MYYGALFDHLSVECKKGRLVMSYHCRCGVEECTHWSFENVPLPDMSFQLTDVGSAYLQRNQPMFYAWLMKTVPVLQLDDEFRKNKGRQKDD